MPYGGEGFVFASQSTKQLKDSPPKSRRRLANLKAGYMYFIPCLITNIGAETMVWCITHEAYNQRFIIWLRQHFIFHDQQFRIDTILFYKDSVTKPMPHFLGWYMICSI